MGGTVESTDLIGLTGFTANGVFFANPSGVFSQDAGFIYDNSTDSLGLGVANFNDPILGAGFPNRFKTTQSGLSFGFFGSGVDGWATISNGTITSYWGISVGLGLFGTYTDTKICLIQNNAHRICLNTDDSVSIETDLILTPETVTGTDTGDASARAITVTPTKANIKIDCQDTSGACTGTLSEVGAVDGQQIRIVNISTNNVVWTDTAGVQEMTGNFTQAQWQTINFIYTTDRWVEGGRASN